MGKPALALAICNESWANHPLRKQSATNLGQTTPRASNLQRILGKPDLALAICNESWANQTSRWQSATNLG